MTRALSRRFHENPTGETDDWYTPPEIFEALGLTFDLDPAHPGAGTAHCCVPARRIYTKADNGLMQPWFGLLFVNMPFGRRNTHVPWLQKFLDHGNGVAIVRAYTSSGWWHQEMPQAEMILFPKGKTKFVRPDGSIGKEPGHGVVLVGMGTVACEALQKSNLGMIWDRRTTPATGGPGQSPIREAIMAKSKTTEVIEEIKETEETEKTAASIAPPITVGNPASAASLTIDQTHMEEFANAEEKSPDIRFGKPPKGNYFTVPAETTKPWKDRAFYYLLEMEGRDPLIVAPHIAKQKISEGEDVIRPILIVRYVTMAGEEGLWPLKLDKPDTKSNRFNKSALMVLEEAEKGWVRLISAKGHYRFTISKKTLKQMPPKFSNRSYQELIDLEFKDRSVTSLDHEIWEVLDQGSDK
jgi:DNA N-6-adenine-methyltransferase (Dam)